MQVKLNPQQQKAVDHIYGPLLVLAGPGTGKTQLLSARIAQILLKTDANPQNILCLTFTEAAAQNMRERLASIIKDDAYDVHINTYHGFGSDIIRSYPDFFETVDLETGKDSRLEKPIDELQSIQIFTEIINKLPYSSPLIGARNYVKNVVHTVSELKRGLYTPDSLKALAQENLKLVRELSPAIAEHIGIIKSFPRTADASIELFSGVLEILQDKDGLAAIAADELEHAMTEALELQKSKPLTEWKNKWLTKDEDNNFRFTDESQHVRMMELADVYARYQQALEDRQLYDFDDMILRVIDAMKSQDELRYNLQEKYQFILLDEFQDTNSAQFELVQQLANNPVNEGQPNVFAVGDDDQAIYAFQGARVSNMLAFKNAYRDVAIINLTENYRSHADILHTAHNVAQQIESRLHHNLENVNKTLTSSSNQLPSDAIIERHEFSGQANEFAWVASRIKKLVDSGTNPSEIAILAPKHKLLENMVPFLVNAQVQVAYEKREDILQTPLMRSFRLMVELIIACAANDEPKMNQLFPQVLSLEFYAVPVQNIWKVNWAYRSQDDERSWAEIALENDTLAPHVLFYLHLGLKSAQDPLEYILDYLTGSTPVKIDTETTYRSPLKDYYFSTKESDSLAYFEALTNLSTIREHLRTYQAGEDALLGLQDFINFITAYETAEQPLINSHPIAQAMNSVQLMTAYKAKGLEFEHVFLLSVHDDVWGKKAKGNSNKISLPTNITHIRYQGSSEDELRRILFVAITRAKHGLYLTSHALKDSGKTTEPVKYLLEYNVDGEGRKTTVIPENKQNVHETVYDAQSTMKNIELLWESRHLELTADLKSLLKPRIDSWQMAPTHLNSFIDLQNGGPEAFLLQTLLRFPQAPGESGEFGNAIHTTLDWYQRRITNGKTPSIDQVLKEFDKNLRNRYIAPNRMDDFRNRGHHALKTYISERSDMFACTAQSEVDFRKEGVLIGNAHLAGKIDRLEVDKANKSVAIVDFKTGSPHKKWERSIKLMKYKQQLYFYKFLIEGSHSWANYSVSEARLEFVEPDSSGKIVQPLKIDFNAGEEEDMKKLIQKVYECVKNFDFPSHENLSDDFTGTQSFINHLLD